MHGVAATDDEERDRVTLIPLPAHPRAQSCWQVRAAHKDTHAWWARATRHSTCCAPPLAAGTPPVRMHWRRGRNLPVPRPRRCFPSPTARTQDVKRLSAKKSSGTRHTRHTVQESPTPCAAPQRHHSRSSSAAHTACPAGARRGRHAAITLDRYVEQSPCSAWGPESGEGERAAAAAVRTRQGVEREQRVLRP